MGSLPIFLLCLCVFLDIVNSLHWLLAQGLIVQGLDKWLNLASAGISALATLIAAALLIAKKYKPMVIGFSVTLLGAAMFFSYTSWTLFGFKNS